MTLYLAIFLTVAPCNPGPIGQVIYFGTPPSHTCTGTASSRVEWWFSDKDKKYEALAQGARVFKLTFFAPCGGFLDIKVKELHRYPQPQQFNITETPVEVR